MEVDNISEILNNSSGFHIIKLLNKKASNSKNIGKQITQAKVSHILIKTSESVSNSNAEEQLKNITKRLNKGEDFAMLARAYSDDSSSANEGGNLGWVDSGTMRGNFDEKMNSIKVGKYSKPFKTQFGWHILFVKERRKHTNNREQTQAIKQIRERKYKEELQIWLRQLRNEAYIKINNK
jgi:peptidyl-prolyl cis-trans isomerase SurA